MKEVIREYGNTVLVVFVALSMIGLLRILPGIIGDFVKVQTDEKLIRSESVEEIREYENMGSLTVSYDGESSLVAKQELCVNDWFVAKSSTGRQTWVELLKAEASSGESIYPYMRDGKQTIVFEQGGIYQMFLRVKDDTNREIIAKISIPVQEGGAW